MVPTPETWLRAHPVFARAPTTTVESLARSARLRTVAAGTTLLSEGEEARSLFVLCQGAVRVYHRAEGGEEVSLKLFRAPAIFGEAEAFSDVAFQQNADTLEDSVLLEIPTEAARAFFRASADAAFALVEDLSARLAISSYNQRSLAFHPVTIRLANYLLDFAEWTNAEGAKEWTIAIGQDEMAAAIGATRRSIGKDVTSWQAEGILARRGARYVVTDPKALQRYADPHRLRIAHRIG